MGKWTVIQRETKTFEDGKLIITTEEPIKKKNLVSQNTKDILQLILSLGIFIPLLVIFLNQRQDRLNKRNEALSQIYSEITFDLDIVKIDSPSSTTFKTASQNLINKYHPKIRCFNIDSLNCYYKSFVECVILYKKLKLVIEKLEEFNGIYKKVFRGLAFGVEVSTNSKKYFNYTHDIPENSKIHVIMEDSIFKKKQQALDDFFYYKKQYLMFFSGYLADIKQIPILYKSDSTVEKINNYRDLFFNCLEKMESKCYAVRRMIYNNASFEDKKLVLLNMFPEEFYPLTYEISNGKAKLESILDSLNNNFQNKVLSLIEN